SSYFLLLSCSHSPRFLPLFPYTTLFRSPLLSTGSGSCKSRTKLCVPVGTCDHFSSGDGAVGPAAWVYLSEMTPPSSQADEVMMRSEEHTSELQSLRHLVCRLLLEKKKKN